MKKKCQRCTEYNQILLLKNIYLVPRVLGAPGVDVLVVGGGTARARGAAAGAVAAAVGGGQVALETSGNGGAGLHAGGEHNSNEDKDDEVHFTGGDNLYKLDTCGFDAA